MEHDYTFYGWQASYFAGKTRAYLNYKGMDYVNKEINLFDILFTIPKNTGRKAMPAIKCSDGNWLCDTPLIMEELEKCHPQPSIEINTPIQRFVAELFQNWMDDMGIPIALHSRWSYPENYEKLNREEAGKNLLPFMPKFIRNKVADKALSDAMSEKLPNMGAIPEQIPLLEKWTTQILSLLEIHFSQYDYVLGGRPTVADYALLGLMQGHLNRDPWPKREWMDPRANLQKWVEKTHRGDATSGDLLADDKIPDTLMPIVKIIFDEYLPLMDVTVQKIEEEIQKESLKSGDELPRTTERFQFKMADSQFKRASFSYSVWRMQRLQQMVSCFADDDQHELNAWLKEQGQEPFLNLDFGPKLKRDGLTAALA